MGGAIGSRNTMQPGFLLVLLSLFCFTAAGPAPGLLWDLEDWLDDIHYNATHNNGGLFGPGLFVEPTKAPSGLLNGLLNLFFPTTTTTAAPTTTTKCGGLIGLGLAC